MPARMRLIGRSTGTGTGTGTGTAEVDSANAVPNADADVVLQLGDSKIPLKATQLLGASVCLSRQPGTERLQKPQHPLDGAPSDQDKAIDAFSRMQEALSPRLPAADTAFCPWSPDDLYHQHPYQSQPNLFPANTSSHTLHGQRRDLSGAHLPAYHDPAEHPYYVVQQTSASAVRGMALHQGPPTIFDNFGEAIPPRRPLNSTTTEMREHEPTQPSKTTSRTSSRTSRRLDLVQLFPQPRPSRARVLSHSRRQRSPSAMTERKGFPLPSLPTDPDFRRSQPISTRPSTSGAGTGRRKQRPFDEDILDQHKTNVRRPPKGIQNWFDAYLSSDDDDDEEDEEGYDLDEKAPQELPADNVLPPAYSGPGSILSHASEKSASDLRGHERIHSNLKSLEHDIAHAHFHRKTSSSDSGTSNSIQSSRQGTRWRDKYESRLASSTMAGDSVPSISESDYDEEDYDDDGGSPLPPIRDSIMNMDSGHITIANASSIDVVRMQRPIQLSSVRQLPAIDSKRSSSQSSVPTPIAGRQDKPLAATHVSNAAGAEHAALCRLNGLGYESGQSISSGTSSRDVGDSVYSDNAHLMAVSEEEKMLLDIMRRKRAAMQQMSFTEGYQLALQTEQDRLAKHSASAEQRALKALKKKSPRHSDHESAAQITTSPYISSESNMRRQFSAIRRSHVDERFQIERFLGMSQPQPLSSHPPDDESTPVETPRVRMLSGDLLPSTRFSPTDYSSVSEITHTDTEENSGYCSADDCETESARIRVRQFISTNGAVPPLNSMKTMRRRSSRQPASKPPSPIAEEHAAPPLPQRSPDRPMMRDFSFDEALSRKVSCVSMPNEMQNWRTSPVSAYMSPNAEIIDDVQMRSLHGISKESMSVPPRAEGATSVPLEVYAKPSVTPAPAHISFSPFSNIISAAAASKPGVHRVDSTQETREQDTTFMSGGNGSKPTLPRLNTHDTRLDQRASMLSITSAGEEVLGAWADLGGGRDCLRTKRKPPPEISNTSHH